MHCTTRPSLCCLWNSIGLCSFLRGKDFELVWLLRAGLLQFFVCRSYQPCYLSNAADIGCSSSQSFGHSVVSTYYSLFKISLLASGEILCQDQSPATNTGYVGCYTLLVACSSLLSKIIIIIVKACRRGERLLHEGCFAKGLPNAKRDHKKWRKSQAGRHKDVNLNNN